MPQNWLAHQKKMHSVNMHLINKVGELQIKTIGVIKASLIRCSREGGMFDNNRTGLILRYSFTKLYQMCWHIKAKREVTLEIPCRWCRMFSFCGFTTLSGLLVVYTQLWICFLNSQISLSIKKSFQQWFKAFLSFNSSLFSSVECL